MSPGVAVVTGARGGIGSAVVARLTADGLRVAAFDVVPATGPGGHPYTVDVRDTVGVDAAMGRVEAELGPITVLVNVAGILRVAPVVAITDDDWSEVFNVNTHGALRCARAAARLMMARRHGCIVTVASNAGTVPRIGMAAYAASKAATIHAMRCLGLELAGYGIRCNVVSPGSTDTAMQRALWTNPAAEAGALEGVASAYRVGIPLGRVATPADVADAVAFLASDAARQITLQNLRVDGGASLG